MALQQPLGGQVIRPERNGRLLRVASTRTSPPCLAGDHGNQRDVPPVAHLPGGSAGLLIGEPVPTLGLRGIVENIVTRNMETYVEVAEDLAK